MPTTAAMLVSAPVTVKRQPRRPGADDVQVRSADNSAHADRSREVQCDRRVGGRGLGRGDAVDAVASTLTPVTRSTSCSSLMRGWLISPKNAVPNPSTTPMTSAAPSSATGGALTCDVARSRARLAIVVVRSSARAHERRVRVDDHDRAESRSATQPIVSVDGRDRRSVVRRRRHRCPAVNCRSESLVARPIAWIACPTVVTRAASAPPPSRRLPADRTLRARVRSRSSESRSAPDARLTARAAETCASARYDAPTGAVSMRVSSASRFPAAADSESRATTLAGLSAGIATRLRDGCRASLRERRLDRHESRARLHHRRRRRARCPAGARARRADEVDRRAWNGVIDERHEDGHERADGHRADEDRPIDGVPRPRREPGFARSSRDGGTSRTGWATASCLEVCPVTRCRCHRACLTSKARGR